MKIYNRRYTGSKYKLIPWITEILKKSCVDCNSFFDVFGGTGVVTDSVLNLYTSFTLNDFLYSNEVVYKGFFEQADYSRNKLDEISNKYNSIDVKQIDDNYVSINFGDKYFSYNDAKVIGYIRQDIEDKLSSNSINKKEYYILLASLLYSFDKISNTVGHYEAFIKCKTISDEFKFLLIEPRILKEKKSISIERMPMN